MISADCLLDIVHALEQASVPIWLDGGWGVDALLGRQTRPHDDLDVVLALDHKGALMAALKPLGFALHVTELPTRFVLADAFDRRIDIHTVTFDAAGGGVQRLPGGRHYRYPPDGFLAVGKVLGHAIPCLSAAVQVSCHLGYTPDRSDFLDVRLLCQTFDLPLPPIYQSFCP